MWFHIALISVNNVPTFAFSIWLSLVLVGPAFTGWCLSWLCARKPISAPVGNQPSPGTDCWGAAHFLGAVLALA